MSDRSRTRLAHGGVAAALGLSLGLTLMAGPASAERVGLDDPADAQASLNDIYSVAASYGQKRAKIDIVVDDLQSTTDGGPAGLEIFIDTKPRRKGPEYRLATGLRRAPTTRSCG